MRLSNPSPKSHSNKKATCNNQNFIRKLTMGLDSYKQIKQAHLKKQICSDYINQINDNRECTFHPNLIQSSSNKKTLPQRRSLKKFLEDQQKFTNDKKQKIQQLRNQISKSTDEEFKSKPSIDQNSHRISTHIRHSRQNTENSQNNSVFERLSKEKKILHDVYEQEQIFSPKICLKSRQLKRDKDVSNLLYEDAIRRQQKQELNLVQFLKKPFTPNINNNTNQLVIKKIYQEYISLIQSHHGSSQSSNQIRQNQISPLLAINILCELFNVDLNPNKSQQQEILCEKVLFYIANTKTQMVNVEVLWNFIQTIINGHLIDSNFNQDQESQIVQTFGHFYNKRLTKPKKNVTPEKCQFRPKTLKSSQKLAQNHRQRTLQSVNQYLETQKVHIQVINNSVKIQDLFIIERMKLNAQNERKRIEKYNAELEQCSFKPDLNLSKKKNTENQVQNKQKRRITLIVPKTTKTQQLKKKLIKVRQKNQDVQNIENKENNLERVKTVYEFGDKCSKSIKSTTVRSKRNQEKAEVKNIEKSIMRLTLARKNRQFKNALNERGYPQNVDNWESFRKSLKKQIQKSNQKLLKGFNSVDKSSMKSSLLLTQKNISRVN